jgi:sporulation protein YlmC with PRC-barrel domain
MEKCKLFYKLFILILLISSCNSSNSKKENELDLNKNPQTHSEKLSKVTQEEKILFFEDQFGSYKFTFRGNKVDILYKYSDYTSPIEKAELKDGKIITEGCSECYVLNQNSLCVPNPETGESDCYAFIRSKSTHDIEETINPELIGYFKGQVLKDGEKVIKINWAKENKANYTRDMSYSGSRYTSESLTVPNGKKWILLYINEDFTFESGDVVGSVPDLFIDNRENEIGNRRFSNESNINLSRAKDENIKIYSGSTIKAISSRTNGNGVGDDFVEYKGEMWFLEIND